VTEDSTEPLPAGDAPRVCFCNALDQVPRHLRHPKTVGDRRDSRDLHLPRREIHHEEDDVPHEANAAPESLSLGSQLASLVVCESQSPLAEQLAQHAVLFLEVFDDAKPLLVDPAR